MKKLSLVLITLIAVQAEASIFSPAVTCDKKLNSASCGIKNVTSKVMSCEFLVVGETKKGELVTKTNNSIVLPYDSAELEISANTGMDDQIKFASGEANCINL